MKTIKQLEEQLKILSADRQDIFSKLKTCEGAYNEQYKRAEALEKRVIAGESALQISRVSCESLKKIIDVNDEHRIKEVIKLKQEIKFYKIMSLVLFLTAIILSIISCHF